MPLGTHAPDRLNLRRHLLDVDALGANGIARLLDLAESMKDDSSGRPRITEDLRGAVVVNLFYEPSTRTRISFEIAAKNLGATVVNMTASESSVMKGESLVDTMRTLDSLGASLLVIRHQEAGAQYLIARHFSGAVVNAGDGQHAHPTQALLDLLTLRQHFGRLGGLKVAIVGDILHGRVARSTAIGLALCGAEVRLCAPPTLLPEPSWSRYIPAPDGGTRVRSTTSLQEALDGVDAVIALRMQNERQQGGLLPSMSEYVRLYGINQERLDTWAPRAVVMHPGPVNEGVELSPEVVMSERSLIGSQVTNGVLVRMAVLKDLSGELNE